MIWNTGVSLCFGERNLEKDHKDYLRTRKGFAVAYAPGNEKAFEAGPATAVYEMQKEIQDLKKETAEMKVQLKAFMEAIKK